MEEIEIEVNSPAELGSAAQQILGYAAGENMYVFEGEMGAGKTTLIKALTRAMGVSENVSSPTFSIVNEYDAQGQVVYHFDFYRIKTLQEAYDIGYEEYFYSGNTCLIEWPERIEEILPDRYVKVKLLPIGENERRIIVTKISG